MACGDADAVSKACSARDVAANAGNTRETANERVTSVLLAVLTGTILSERPAPTRAPLRERRVARRLARGMKGADVRGSRRTDEAERRQSFINV